MAPVLDPGVQEVSVYFPALSGRWLHVWSDVVVTVSGGYEDEDKDKDKDGYEEEEEEDKDKDEDRDEDEDEDEDIKVAEAAERSGERESTMRVGGMQEAGLEVSVPAGIGFPPVFYREGSGAGAELRAFVKARGFDEVSDSVLLVGL